MNLVWMHGRHRNVRIARCTFCQLARQALESACRKRKKLTGTRAAAAVMTGRQEHGPPAQAWLPVSQAQAVHQGWQAELELSVLSVPDSKGPRHPREALCRLLLAQRRSRRGRDLAAYTCTASHGPCQLGRVGGHAGRGQRVPLHGGRGGRSFTSNFCRLWSQKMIRTVSTPTCTPRQGPSSSIKLSLVDRQGAHYIQSLDDDQRTHGVILPDNALLMELLELISWLCKQIQMKAQLG